MGDEADGYGARFSIDLACVSPGHSRFKVEFSCGRHIDAVLGAWAIFLSAVKLNRQDLIVYIIKWNVKLSCPVLGTLYACTRNKETVRRKNRGKQAEQQ